MLRKCLPSKFKTYCRSIEKFQGFREGTKLSEEKTTNTVNRPEDVLKTHIVFKDHRFEDKGSWSRVSKKSTWNSVSESYFRGLSAVHSVLEQIKTNRNNKEEKHLAKLYSRIRNRIHRNTLGAFALQGAAIEVSGVTKSKIEETAANPPALISEPSVTNATPAAESTFNTVFVTDPIPEPPPVPDVVENIVNQINAIGEPTFASLGLGGSMPVGWVQNCFEYFHVTLGVPWWEAIVLGTLFIRLLMFPLVILAQRNAAKMNNYLPQMQSIQLKMTEARQTGNQLDVARYSQELMLFMKEKGVNPFKNMLVPFAQMPVFISFFMGLRQMANVPVESMREGGILWFSDLTVPDQYMLMPLITSATLWATIELGTDTAKLSAQNLQMMKYVLRALPVIIIPFTVNFPGAILVYWVSSNFISLAQVGFLRIPAVRNYFKIEALISHRPEHLPMKPKGFTQGLKDSWTNMKLTSELEERRKLDEIQFKRAGKGPIVKTFKFDPTKHMDTKAINAKER